MLFRSRLVVLLDASGSMSAYTGTFLRFIHGVLDEFREAEAFLFHTRLAYVSGAMKEKDAARALDRLSLLAQGAGIFGTDHAEVELRLRLFAIGDAQAISWEPNPADVLYMMYHFYKQPKGFTGGGIRLFDGRTENGMRPAIASFRDVEIGNNDMLIFPEKVVGAGLPVRCPTRAFADGLFVVRGIMRRGPASE